MKTIDGHLSTTVDLQDLAVTVEYNQIRDFDVTITECKVYVLDGGAKRIDITDLLTENQREVLLDEINEDIN